MSILGIFGQMLLLISAFGFMCLSFSKTVSHEERVECKLSSIMFLVFELAVRLI